MPEMKQVHSSHIHSIGHDDGADELHVVYRTGKRAIYSGVGSEKAKRIMGSWSIGKALHDEIKGKHSHRYEAEA